MKNLIENDIYILPKKISSDNYGLYEGKMGVCISLYVSEQPADNIKAGELLDEIGENVCSIESFSFNDGLLGIGWGIEWLAQNQMLEVNTNEVLEDLDDEVYKLIMYNKADSIELNTGTLGRLLYLYKRVTSKNPDTNFYKDICNKECLVLLIDELYDHFLNGDSAIINQDMESLDSKRIENISQSLIMLCKLIPLRYNYDLVNEMICKIVSKIELFFSNERPGHLINSSIFLLNAWRQAGVMLGANQWAKGAEEKYKEISLNIDPLNLDDRSVFILREFGSLYPLVFRNNKSIFCNLYNDKSSNNWAEGWLLR